MSQLAEAPGTGPIPSGEHGPLGASGIDAQSDKHTFELERGERQPRFAKLRRAFGKIASLVGAQNEQPAGRGRHATDGHPEGRGRHVAGDALGGDMVVTPIQGPDLQGVAGEVGRHADSVAAYVVNGEQPTAASGRRADDNVGNVVGIHNDEEWRNADDAAKVESLEEYRQRRLAREYDRSGHRMGVRPEDHNDGQAA